jgi:site-specific recombinase XerC
MTLTTGHPYGAVQAAPPALAGTTILAELGSYANSLQAEGKSRATVSLWVGAAKALHTFLADNGMPTDVAAIRREHIESWLVSLHERGSKPSTVNNRFRSVQPLWKWLKEVGEIRESPMRNMRQPAVPDSVVETPDADAVVRLLAHVRKDKSFEGIRDYAILRMLTGMGLRRAELVGMGVADVDPDQSRIRVKRKGGWDAVLAVPPQAAKALDLYRRARRKHHQAARDEFWVGRRGPLTGWGIHQMLERRSDEARVPRMHPHQLRHFWAHINKMNGTLTDEELREAGGWTASSRVPDKTYGRSVAAERARAAMRLRAFEV